MATNYQGMMRVATVAYVAHLPNSQEIEFGISAGAAWLMALAAWRSQRDQRDQRREDESQRQQRKAQPPWAPAVAFWQTPEGKRTVGFVAAGGAVVAVVLAATRDSW